MRSSERLARRDRGLARRPRSASGRRSPAGCAHHDHLGVTPTRRPEDLLVRQTRDQMRSDLGPMSRASKSAYGVAHIASAFLSGGRTRMSPRNPPMKADEIRSLLGHPYAPPPGAVGAQRIQQRSSFPWRWRDAPSIPTKRTSDGAETPKLRCDTASTRRWRDGTGQVLTPDGDNGAHGDRVRVRVRAPHAGARPRHRAPSGPGVRTHAECGSPDRPLHGPQRRRGHRAGTGISHGLVPVARPGGDLCSWPQEV